MSSDQFNASFLPAPAIKALADGYAGKGIPGITIMARKGNQYWQYNTGLSNAETGDSMKACMVWPAYSITKMYTATAVLKLVEEGKIGLDQKINTCLPANIVAQVPGAEKISVKMLLNHSSGIENFWENPLFIVGYMENPFQTYTVSDFLEAARERLFEPGADIAYSNTNYLLLALIIDEVTKQNHIAAFRKWLFEPLGLTATFYKTLPAGQLNNIPRLYADVDGSGELIEYTQLSLLQFANESGSNSLLSTAKEFVDYLFGLTHKKILGDAIFNEMKTPYRGQDADEEYGLGLEFFLRNGIKLYGHSGSSFGGRTVLLYNPRSDISFFVGVNAGAELGGPVLETIASFMDELVTRMAF